MTAYATTAELAVRMRTTFSDADEAYAESILDEIGTYLASVVDIDPEDSAQAQLLCYASLSMAARAMESAGASDVSSITEQAGSYSQTVSYASPYRTNNWWKLLKSSGYARLLGVGNGIGFARPSYGRLEPQDA